MALWAMKWLGLTMMLVFASLSPIVSATEVYEETNHLSSYSKAVQTAFERCADESVNEGKWLVVSSHPLGEKAPYLPHAWLVEADLSEINWKIPAKPTEASLVKMPI